MKQVWPNYSYSPTTNVLTLTGLNIDQDQLLLVTAADRGRIMYNFADSTITASAFTAGANTGLTLVASTAGLTTTAALVIYYDDQLQSTAISISNFPASQTTTFGAVTGSVSVLNFPASQATTFGAVTGSVSVLNFPASQSVTFSDASLTNTQLRASAVTIGGTVTASISGTVPVSGTFFQTTQPVSLSNLPALVAGTAQIGSVTASISGTVPVSGTFFQTTQPVSLATVPTHGVTLASTTVTVSSLPAISGTVTIGAGTAQIGSVTASISGTVPVSGTFYQATQPVSISSVTVGNSVTIASLPAISGTVTANASNGTLTTRFGSVVTANTSFASTAVTNSNRKYLLIQNVTTSTNSITIGIGFTPTTTQGIQLIAGAGLIFDGSYIPTGSVNILSSVTASTFTILEA